ncbi:MAG: hypothetical protein WC326_14545 [Candidatus Delongbacteria bacterium]
MKPTAWLVLALLTAAAARPALAEMCESTGEYEYTYGDAESIMSAKQRCENLAIRAAIEQCAVFVSSTTNIENYQLKDDLVSTLAAALVKQKKVLEQRVDGRTIYYKVSIKLDDTQMMKAIEAEQKRLQAAQPAVPPAAAAQAQPVQAQPAQTQPAAPAEPVKASPVVPAEKKPEPAPAKLKAQPTAAPGEPKRTLAVQFGSKSLKKSDWEPVEKQGQFGVHFDTPLGGLPVSLALDFLASAKSGTIVVSDGWFDYEFDVTAVTYELTAGLRYTIPVAGGKLLPYVGAGLGLMGASQELDDGSDKYSWTGSTIGFAFDAGVLVPLGPVVLGLDLRNSSAKPTMKPDDDNFDDYKVACGGTSFNVVLGFAW